MIAGSYVHPTPQNAYCFLNMLLSKCESGKSGASAPLFGAHSEHSSGFVSDCRPYLLADFCWNFIHTVLGTGMLGNLAHNFFFAVSPRYEIAICSNISTADGLGHKVSFRRRSLAQKFVNNP